MILKHIDSTLLKEMIVNAAVLLESHKEEINALNVFPVPDGDTGTNMSFTMKGAVAEINKTKINGIELMAEALSRGALKGARGNSGVILSQIFRGFYSKIKNKVTVNAKEYAVALNGGVEMAYKAVMKPREGTILTVCKAIAKAATHKAEETSDIIKVMQHAIEEGKAMLLRTPEMLDVLKKAGVVDAGGEGLLLIFRGYLSAMLREEPAADITQYNGSAGAEDLEAYIDNHENINFTYCTELFVINMHKNTTNMDIEVLKHKLNDLGDSLILVGDTELVKIHVHTDEPGKVLEYCTKIGEANEIKIDNMREENRKIKEQNKIVKKNGVVVVTSGIGLADIFNDLGVDVVVEGGQTMNPSTEDLARAIVSTKSENVYVLPNNSNIILAAQHAQQIVDCNVFVLESKSTPQGISAMLSYDPEGGDGMFENMRDALDEIITGQITYAVRDSFYDDLKINKDDIMGIIDGNISIVGNDISKVAKELIEKMLELSEDAEIITIYKGIDISEEQAQNLCDVLSDTYPDFDVDLQNGQQPVYYYILSIE